MANELPPGRYFLSHSYGDRVLKNGYRLSREISAFVDPAGNMVDVDNAIDPLLDPVALMKSQIPEPAAIYTFPQIKPPPSEFVSNALIGAMLACDGLIYLSEGFSTRSFWVAFERDYALRAGKPVYTYQPSTRTLTKHNEPPLDLAVHLSHTQADLRAVDQVRGFMRDERFFDIWTPSKTIGIPNWREEARQVVQKTAERGGYVVVFWSEAAEKSRFIRDDYETAAAQGRALLAGLDMTKSILLLTEYAKDYYVPLADEHGINNQFIDNLIVRLYWLIFRNQFPELITDETEG